MRKVILYIAMSLDGYIATREGDISFLSGVEQKGQDYGYEDFVQTVDTIIIGKRTIDKVRSMGFQYPHTDKKVYIISRTPKPDSGPFTYYTGSLPSLVKDLKSKPGKNIYCDGGAIVVNELLKHKLIDEFIISIIPVMLGDGIKLFSDGRPGQNLELVDYRRYETGLIQLHYKIIN